MSLYFRIPLPGPFGYSKRIGGRKRRRRSSQPAYHGTLPGWQCHHNHRTQEAARECADQEARRRGLSTAPAPARAPANRQEPVMTYPEPAPYVYCRVIAARFGEDRTQAIFSLVSDSGEKIENITATMNDDSDADAQVNPGDRFTWDGRELENHIPAGLIAQYQQLQAKMNAMDAWKRAEARQDADMVQQFRNAGYVFDSDNRLVSAVTG
jgi:hypothetical protein